MWPELMIIKSKISLVYMAAVIISGILLVGCASMTTDLAEQGDVVVETVPVDNVRYLYPHVTQKAMTVTVSGTVSLDDASEYRHMASHMDVTILDESDEPMFVAYAPYVRAASHGFAGQARFATSARLLVPKNSRVIMRHHKNPMPCHQVTAANSADCHAATVDSPYAKQF